jgi:hypothetical protein
MEEAVGEEDSSTLMVWEVLEVEATEVATVVVRPMQLQILVVAVELIVVAVRV